MTAAHATPLPEITKYLRVPAHEFVILASKLFFWSGTRYRSDTVVSGNSFWFDFSDTYV